LFQAEICAFLESRAAKWDAAFVDDLHDLVGVEVGALGPDRGGDAARHGGGD
jgi:hypothetical protein